MDYQCRRERLANFNVIDFFVDTYEEDISSRDKTSNNETLTDETRRPGRPRNERIRYADHHPKSTQKQCVLRTLGHRNLPNFIGRYFPRRDDPEIYNFYCASMLMLLKPWRNLQTDLKPLSQTWAEAFDGFLSSSTERTKFVLSGIQYFHDCESAACNSRAEHESAATYSCMEVGNEEEELGEDILDTAAGLSEEGLAEFIAAQTRWDEELHARLAVEKARQAGIFKKNKVEWTLHQTNSISNASGDDIQKLLSWKDQMKGDVLKQNSAMERPQELNATRRGEPRVELITPDNDTDVSTAETTESIERLASEAALAPVDPSMLKPDQFRAYDIVLWHLDQTLAGCNPPPLRMILYGEGGTGKSKVIQTITEAFVQRQSHYMLLKSAYTGIAASLIDGKTTHTIAFISFKTISSGKISNETKAKLQKFWKDVHYLIIDEYSMLSKTFLALLSHNIGLGKEGSGTEHCDHSFGGLNVILCGDLHQFPPVAAANSDVLYQPIDIANDTVERQLGRKLYEEFTTVVILKEQMRVSDPVWREFLEHLRNGHVKEHHIKMLRTLIIGNNKGEPTDFEEEPWSEASLVTPRHAVRKHWNAAAVQKWCQKTGEQLIICHAEDTINGRTLTLSEKYRLATRNPTEKRRKRKDLPETVELARGMKVMVTNNVETDLDITNGARGEIVDIILHPDEPPLGDEPVMHLKYPPAYILVKLTRTRATRLEGLEETVIPVEVASATMQITVKIRKGKTLKRTVQRRQYPVTAAYAFTDYRSQGQTIPYVIVDIATPPTGTLSLFNLYVALSRSSGRGTIRLLRDFDEGLFKKSHQPELMMEDDRLERYNGITKTWWEKMGRGRDD